MKYVTRILVTIMIFSFGAVGCSRGAEKEEDSETNFESTSIKETTTESDENGAEPQETEIILHGEELFTAFVEGSEKAKFRGTAEYGSYFLLSDFLTEGEFYNINEIIELAENYNQYMELKANVKPSKRLIDCGEDGTPELLCEIHFGAEFTLHMILKEIDDELVIIYNRDSWSRSDLKVMDNGTISSFGSSGATAHGGDFSYIDANGDYHFFYGYEDYGEPHDYYAYDNKGEYVCLDFSNLDTESLMISSYWIDQFPEKRGANYYILYEINDKYEVINSSELYQDSNPYKLVFNEAKIPVSTEKEVFERLKVKAEDIGYPLEEESIILKNLEEDEQEP